MPSLHFSRPAWKPRHDDNLSLAKKYPIEKLYRGRLRPVGKVMMGLCPFHEEHTPSFAVYPQTNTWHCFACGLTGDVIDFYMRLNGTDFKETIKDLNR